MVLQNKFESSVSDKRFYYGSLAGIFHELDNPYDLKRRLEVVFDELIADLLVRSALILDAGCGYGPFTGVIMEKVGNVVSMDIADQLVRQTVEDNKSQGVVGDSLSLGFAPNSFDLVISSEMIEHTLSPNVAIRQMARVIKPGGYLVLTTPNKIWRWVVRLASLLRLRSFQGIEIFLGWSELSNSCRLSDLEIIKHVGFHPWPFQVKFLNRISRKVDRRFGESLWAKIMINQAILAQKSNSS